MKKQNVPTTHKFFVSLLSTFFALVMGSIASRSLAAPALESAVIGKEGPAFELKSSNDEAVKLSDYKGKIVVLEWYNPGCPFVKKHYKNGDMQKLQAAHLKDGVVWFLIDSSAPGKEGYLAGKELKEQPKKAALTDSPNLKLLVDPTGTVGKAYGALTTPHFFILNKKGILAYKGAVDSIPSTDSSDIAKATNYVSKALGELKADKAVSETTTKAYGCGVKYGN